MCKLESLYPNTLLLLCCSFIYLLVEDCPIGAEKAVLSTVEVTIMVDLDTKIKKVVVNFTPPYMVTRIQYK
jgi:hypothetical protein